MSSVSFETYRGLVPPPNSIQPNFIRMLAALTQPMIDAQNLLNEMPKYFDIETAVGKQLDVLGDILQLPRVVNFEPGDELIRKSTTLPMIVNYDTPNTDLVISQVENKIIYLNGIQLMSADPFDFTVKSDVNVICRLEYDANSGLKEPYRPVKPGLLCKSELGQAMVFNCNVALPPFLIFITEGD